MNVNDILGFIIWGIVVVGIVFKVIQAFFFR